ncbi:MAG: YicC family protein [Bacteroidales bacterium]|nr:YicC family protein [Bacteroidales bacterium]
MIQSMTGFGKATAEIANKKVTVEIKSVNSKQLDLMAKICPQYREREMEFRQLVQRKMQRGKVELSVSSEVLEGSAEAPHINTAIIKEYQKQIDAVRKELGMVEFNDSVSSVSLMNILLRLPDAVHVETPVIGKEELDAVVAVVEQAVDKLVEFRLQEGQSLYRVFTEKIDNIRALLTQIEPYEKERTERIRQNLLDRLEKLPVDYDKNRLEQEMIYYIEKLDINEEKHRLVNHLDYFIETMNAPMDAGGHGKKLGFIAQEMGREINTLGSKSNQAEMQRLVVKMKDELEQIKEQVLNVL